MELVFMIKPILFLTAAYPTERYKAYLHCLYHLAP